MKIKELLHEAPLTDKQEEKFLSKMQQTNYMNSEKELKNIRPTVKKSGQGAFSNVFSDPNKKTVVKISRERDDGAISYLRWCIKNQQNPHVPKILGMSVSPDKKFLYARMEKLIDVTQSNYTWTEKDIPILSYLAAYRQNDISSALMKNILFPLIRENYDLPKDYFRYAYYWENIPGNIRREISKTWKDDPFVALVKTTNKIAQRSRYFVSMDFEFDFPMHNVMLRPSTNTLVLTDPLAG